MTSLAVLEDVSQLPRCPRCRVEVKMRRLGSRWVLYELSPMNKIFLGNLPGLLLYNGDFVFVPHVLCCGAIECPSDPGLARLWERNNERLEQVGGQRDHPTYGMVTDVAVRDVAARMHVKLMNGRGTNLTKSDAVALLDFMAVCGVDYVGGPKLAEPELLPVVEVKQPVTHVAPQCTAISSKTKKQCTQRTNDPSGTCFAHRPKDGVHNPS
jgi:hypothetical protein